MIDEVVRAQIQAQIDALNAAIGTGAVEVQQGNERVKYRSLQEMRSAVAELTARLAGSAAKRPTHFEPTFCRGR